MIGDDGILELGAGKRKMKKVMWASEQGDYVILDVVGDGIQGQHGVCGRRSQEGYIMAKRVTEKVLVMNMYVRKRPGGLCRQGISMRPVPQG